MKIKDISYVVSLNQALWHDGPGILWRGCGWYVNPCLFSKYYFIRGGR